MLQVEAVRAAPRARSENPEPFAQRRLAFSALRELLTRIAQRHALVLHIDDLHWADADSLRLLEALLRPPDPPPLLMLACLRTEEIASKPFLQAFLQGGGTPSRTALLARADDGGRDARDVMASLIPAGARITAAERLELSREAGGNPFLLEQLAHYAVVHDARGNRERDARRHAAAPPAGLAGWSAAVPGGARRLRQTDAAAGGLRGRRTRGRRTSARRHPPFGPSPATQRLRLAHRDVSRPHARDAGRTAVARRDTRHSRCPGANPDGAGRRRSRGALRALQGSRRWRRRVAAGGAGGGKGSRRARVRPGRVLLSQRPRAGAGRAGRRRVEARVGGGADQCRPTAGGRGRLSRGVDRRPRLAAGRSAASSRRTVPHRRPHRQRHGRHPHGPSRLAHAAGAEPAGGARLAVVAARPDPPARARVRRTRPGSHSGGHVCCASIPAGR